MTATFGSLRDDDVGTGGRTALSFGYAARHERYFAAGVVGTADIAFQILLGPRPSQGDRRRLFPQGSCKAILVEQEHQEVEGKWLAGAGPNGGGSIVNLGNEIG